MSMSNSTTTDAQALEGITLSGGENNSSVPPGFRFHPTDEELVGYYLTKKVACNKIDLDVIREIDLYKLEPWDLQERCRIGSAEQHEWYFFSHKDKKYPTGTRTNRATTAGFWKATGRDKPIFAKVKLIGMRKTLVFYKGRAPNGQKSDWIMHEYRLEDDINNTTANEEGWVVCRVFKKRSIVKKPNSDYEGLYCYDVDDSTDKLLLAASSSSFNNNNMNNNFVKQELENGFYFPFPYDAFSQLPRLESPKRSDNIPNNLVDDHHPGNNVISRGSRATADLQQHQQQLQDSLEELVQLAPKSILLPPQVLQGDHQSSNNQFHGFQHDDLGAAASWSMDDRILTELSQDEYSKDTRCGLTGHVVPEMPPFRRQQQQLQQQQQHPEFSYDVDLWSFNR